MPTSYTSGTRQTLQPVGGNANIWGDIANKNFGLIDDSITGIQIVDMTSTTSRTLTTVNGDSDEARKAILRIAGTVNADSQLIVPSLQKIYIIDAVYTGSSKVTVKTPSGAGVDFVTGKMAVVYCDGTDVKKVAEVTPSVGVAGAGLTLANNIITLAQASYDGRGSIQLATLAEVRAGANNDKAVTPTMLSQANMAVPIGTVLPYAGGGTPTGYIPCDGRSISRTAYADLFNAIGTAYGAVDGNSFNVPDIRGRVVAGNDSGANRLNAAGIGAGLGVIGGAPTHTLTTAQMPSHSHSAEQIGGNGSYVRGGGTGGSNYQTGSAGGDQPHNNVQPTIQLNYVIRAV